MEKELVVSIKSRMLLSVYFLLISLHTFSCGSSQNCSGCTFMEHSHGNELLERLKPLCGRSYKVEERSRKYNYYVGICTPATKRFDKDSTTGVQDSTGVTQVDTNTSKSYVLGNTSRADLRGGKNWLMLQYEGGQEYPNSCSKSERKSTIMISCDPSVKGFGEMTFLEERNEKSEDCYYLFQLDHPAACIVETQTDISVLSAGSIFCIIFFSVAAVYLGGGFLFQRFVRKAKGIDQIPNVGFWMELGNLMADGCDLVCRCGRGRDSDQRNKSERLLENASDHVDIDDGLLGM